MPSDRQSEPFQPAWGFLLCILLVLILSGCSRDGRGQRFVARVGTAELTEQEIPATGTTRKAGPASREYVNEWIIDELLYQEGVRRGLAVSDRVHSQLESAKRRLVIAALLEEELFAAADTASIPDAAVEAMYRQSASSYALREEVVLCSYAQFADREAANTFRSAVLRGTPWDSALQHVRQDSVLQLLVRQAATRQYFTQSTLYPPELWKVARTLGTEETSFVVQTGDDYYVLRLHSIKRSGDLPDLAYVREEIRQRLLLEQRQERYEQLIAVLRARSSVEVRMEVLDTAMAH